MMIGPLLGIALAVLWAPPRKRTRRPPAGEHVDKARDLLVRAHRSAKTESEHSRLDAIGRAFLGDMRSEVNPDVAIVSLARAIDRVLPDHDVSEPTDLRGYAMAVVREVQRKVPAAPDRRLLETFQRMLPGWQGDVTGQYDLQTALAAAALIGHAPPAPHFLELPFRVDLARLDEQAEKFVAMFPFQQVGAA